jgi:Mn-dependent DtxR family transcriptional regulator
MKNRFLNPIQDYLSIQIHRLTDDGKRVKLADLKKELNIKQKS